MTGGGKCLVTAGTSSQINHITRAEASVVSSRDRSMPAAVRRSVGPRTTQGRRRAHPGREVFVTVPVAATRLPAGQCGAASRRLPAAAAAVENNFEETHLKSDLNIAVRHVTTGHARRSIYSRVARGDAARSPPLPWQLAVNRIASGGN